MKCFIGEQTTQSLCIILKFNYCSFKTITLRLLLSIYNKEMVISVDILSWKHFQSAVMVFFWLQRVSPTLWLSSSSLLSFRSSASMLHAKKHKVREVKHCRQRCTDPPASAFFFTNWTSVYVGDSLNFSNDKATSLLIPGKFNKAALVLIIIQCCIRKVASQFFNTSLSERVPIHQYKTKITNMIYISSTIFKTACICRVLKMG